VNKLPFQIDQTSKEKMRLVFETLRRTVSSIIKTTDPSAETIDTNEQIAKIINTTIECGFINCLVKALAIQV